MTKETLTSLPFPLNYVREPVRNIDNLNLDCVVNTGKLHLEIMFVEDVVD